MAAADPMFESLQRLQSMMESFDESLSQLRKDNSSESALELWKIDSALELWKILMEYYHDLQKAVQSRYETLKIKEQKPEEPGTRGKNKENETLKVNGLNPDSSSFSKVLLSVEVRPEIKALCDKADGRGLRNYIVDNMNEGETLRNELLVALSKAPDAATLVIKALEDCDLSKNGYSKIGEPSVSSVDREACSLLLESLYPVFGNDDSDIVPSDVKGSARKIAEAWRMKILGGTKEIQKNVNSANKFDVHVFLQLLATFRLAADYSSAGLWPLACAIIPGKRTLELCRSLGLSSRIPNLRKGNPDMALRCAHVAGLMDEIDPVHLLTSYLRREEQRAKALLTKGHFSASSQAAANSKMVYVLRNVIKLSKEYGLQSHFCEDDLQNKLTILLQERENLRKERKEDAKRNAQEKREREKDAEGKAQEEIDIKNAAEKKTQEKEDGEKAAEKSLQNKKRQSFEPGYGPSERENYASKRAKHASPNVTTRVAGGMGNSKASPYNIYGLKKKSGIIGHDHHTSPFSAANRSSTGAAAGGFTSTPSIAAAQINDERRRLPSAFGTSNLTPIGSSFYGSSAPAGAFAVPLYNVAEINYEGRGQQCYTMNLGEVDKNHVRASVYGTGDLAKSSATQSNYNYEGRSQQSYKLNFVEVDNIPVSTSTYGTGVLANSSATQAHYERRGPEMYTSAFGGGNKASIGSSVYGSNSRTIPLSDVNQGGHERSLGQYLGFASRNMVPIESSGYGPDVSRVPSSNVTQGHFESKRAVIDKYRFNSGSSLL